MALVDVCLDVNIELALVVVVDVRTCRHVVVGGVVCESKFAVDFDLRRCVFPLLVIIVEHTLGLIVDNVDALPSVENGCHDRVSGFICIATLVKFKQLFKLLNDSILVTDGLVEGFDVIFLVIRQLVVVGIQLFDPETPGLVTQWIVSRLSVAGKLALLGNTGKILN